MKSNQPFAPVSSLKPLSWFRCQGDPRNRQYCGYFGGVHWCSLGIDGCTRIASVTIYATTEVQPLPDCTSFDWVGPREPTALELAKELRNELSKEWLYGMEARVSEIIAALEREAAK